MKQPAVYLLTSKPNGTLYVGVTSNLAQRIWQHRNNQVEGFTRTHGIHRLVYFELFDDMVSAIEREKRIKKWNRAWKIRVITKANPKWDGLWDSII